MEIFKIKNVEAKKLWNKNVIILVHGLKNVKYFTQNPVTDNRQNNRRLLYPHDSTRLFQISNRLDPKPTI